jgi:CCAAT-binding transcription factor (CBF-B/NF-YA) subunit B
MRVKKMTRKRPNFPSNYRIKSKKNIMYESRSRHAKNRKRAQDGKFLANQGGSNCSDGAMSDSTVLKETIRTSRSRSRS